MNAQVASFFFVHLSSNIRIGKRRHAIVVILVIDYFLILHAKYHSFSQRTNMILCFIVKVYVILQYLFDIDI